MTTSRRKFVKMCSGSFAAAAALIVGRQLPAQGGFTPRTKPTEVSPTLWTTHKFEDGTVEVAKKDWLPESRSQAEDRMHRIHRKAPGEHPTIVRIAHPSSRWVQEGHVESGHFFSHEWLDTECEDLGNEIELTAYRFHEMRAVRFDNYLRGAEPCETYTDPDSAGFKRIVSKCEQRPPNNFGCMYGPVWIMWLKTGEPVEFFCCNKSLRHFAQNELDSKGYIGPMILRTKKLVSKSMGFTWYVPTLRYV